MIGELLAGLLVASIGKLASGFSIRENRFRPGAIGLSMARAAKSA